MGARRLFSLRPADVGMKVVSLEELRAGMAQSGSPPEHLPGKFAEFIGEVLGDRDPIVVVEAPDMASRREELQAGDSSSALDSA